MKKYILNMVCIVGLSLITMYFLLGTDGLKDVEGCMKGIAPLWMLLGLVCIMLYWGFETLIQSLLVKKMCNKHHLWNSFKVVMTGHFFNAITPFASGGQPMQAMTMVQQGVPIGTSASILLSKFIIYQLILTVYSLIVLLLKLNFFLAHINGLVYLSLIGFSINFIIVILLIAIAFMENRVKKVGFNLVNLLHKMHIIKQPIAYKKKIVKQVDIFGRNIQGIKENKRLLFRITILTILQLTAYYLIPYAVYKAFGLTGSEVFLMVSAAAFIVMISSFIPVPGGSGVAEGSFFLLFSLFFPKTILPTAVLCWRIITFYIPLCCGGVMTMLPNSKIKVCKGNILA